MGIRPNKLDQVEEPNMLVNNDIQTTNDTALVTTALVDLLNQMQNDQSNTSDVLERIQQQLSLMTDVDLSPQEGLE